MRWVRPRTIRLRPPVPGLFSSRRARQLKAKLDTFAIFACYLIPAEFLHRGDLSRWTMCGRLQVLTVHDPAISRYVTADNFEARSLTVS